MTADIEALFQRWGPRYKWLATCTVMIGALSMVLAATIVNVAIPDIMDTFGITQDRAQWLSAGYFAAVSATMLANSWAVDSFGPRGTYFGAMSIFMAVSVVGGLAPNEGVLIFSRVAQGAMAGIIQPLSMIIIFHVFPIHERGKGMGIFGLGVVLAPAVGPVVGGVLVDWFSWRAVFYLALPFCLTGMVMGSLFLPARSTSGPRPDFDWFGFMLLAISLASLMWAISNGQQFGWLSWIILLNIVGGVAAAAAFIIWQQRREQPLLNFEVYQSKGFLLGSILSFILGFALFATTYLIPLFAQEIQGMTAMGAGMMMMPAGLLMAAMFPFTGRLSDIIPIGRLIIFGLLSVSLSCFLLHTADVVTAFGALVLWTAIGRAGLAVLMPAINGGSLNMLDISMVTHGSGSLNFARQLGGAFGVSLASLTLDWRTDVHAQRLADALASTGVNITEFLAGLEQMTLLGSAPEHVSEEFIGHAISAWSYTTAFQDSFLLLSAMFVLATIPAWLMGRESRKLRQPLAVPPEAH